MLIPATSAGATDPGAASGSRVVTAPPPWAKAVCGALDGWVSAVDAASTKAATKAGGSTASTKRTLNALLRSTTKETAKLRKRLASAGKPSVAGGKQVAATIREGFRQVESSLKGAQRTIATASASDPSAFTNAVRASQDAVESGLESIQAAFSAARDTDAGALLAAFKAQPACQNVAG